MGRTISLYASTAIEPEDFARFVVDAGGEITDEATITGQVSSGDCHVWFHRAGEQLAGEFEAPGEGVETKLGAPVKASVDLQLSHHEGSGPLALAFAARFVERWSGVATGAVRRVLTAKDVERMLQEGQLPPILSPALEILLATTAEVREVIDGLGGIEVDETDVDMIASARKELGGIEGARHDPDRDRVLGFVPSGDSLVWLLSRALNTSEARRPADLDERLIAVAADHLGARPACLIRVLIGYDSSPERERVAFVICGRVLRAQPGVVTGILYLILDAAGLGELIESGGGVFVS